MLSATLGFWPPTGRNVQMTGQMCAPCHPENSRRAAPGSSSDSSNIRSNFPCGGRAHSCNYIFQDFVRFGIPSRSPHLCPVLYIIFLITAFSGLSFMVPERYPCDQGRNLQRANRQCRCRTPFGLCLNMSTIYSLSQKW